MYSIAGVNMPNGVTFDSLAADIFCADVMFVLLFCYPGHRRIYAKPVVQPSQVPS
jgi:hypothetical protein